MCAPPEPRWYARALERWLSDPSVKRMSASPLDWLASRSKALSDGPQALLPHQFLDLMGDLRRLASAIGREFWAPGEN